MTGRLVSEVEDHPHTCGEYYATNWYGDYHEGSPPHLWGIPVVTSDLVATSRITPTPVGNTDCLDTPNLSAGSPPHLWGIRTNTSTSIIERGITPTPVGNTNDTSIFYVLAKDHPHTCGEYETQELVQKSV